MKTYDLYLESGPRRRKTMVHVFDLLGCVAVGPTTEDALAATPEAIRAFARFLRRHGEPANPEASFDTRIAEHTTEGAWLGNGSPYLLFGPDREPLSDDEIARFLRRYGWLCEDLAVWAEGKSPAQLDAVPPGGGRPARTVLLHLLSASGSYLAAALGGAPGFARTARTAERGELTIPAALRRTVALARERVQATTPTLRAATRDLPQGPRTLRQALRRMLEHVWEHLAELSRRPGGPPL